MSEKIEVVEKPVVKQAKQDDALAAKIRGLEKTSVAVVKFLENMFKFDVNKDGKIGAALQPVMGLVAIVTLALALGASALSPLAGTNSVVSYVGPQSTNALFDIDRSGNVRAQGSVTASGATTVGGALAVTGIATLAGTTTVFSAAATVNTNAAVPLQGIAVRVNGTNYVLKLYPITGP